MAALEAVQAALTTEELMQLDKKVDSDHQDPASGRRGVAEEQESRLARSGNRS